MTSLTGFPRLLRGALLLAIAGTAFAQTPPDAGALQQQIEKDLQRPLPELPQPAAPAVTVPPPAAPTGVKVTVSAFAFVGNTRLTTAQLQAVVARFVGRSLSFAELQGVADVVAEAYRAEGWIVRVFLPQQELADGVVTIQVVEARFGAVRLQPEKSDEPLRVRDERLQGVVFAAQRKGAPVSNRAVDRALLLVDDLPGVAAGGALAAGQVEGETDLVLRLRNEPRAGGDVRLDNTGSRSTGPERLAVNLFLASPSRVGDIATASLLHTEGSNYARLAYRRPVGYGGWSAGVSASAMQYELVGADFAVFDSSGSATTVGVDAAYPLLRGRQYNLNLQLSPEHKRYDNEAAGTTTTRYSIDAFPVTLAGNSSDALGGGGSVTAHLMVSAGDVDLSGSPNAPADAITTKTAGSFTKLHYGLARQQRITDAIWLRVNLAGQVAGKNLDSAEKFYIGGIGGVRAYSSSDGSGSEGTLFNLELRGRLPWHLSPSCFYDWGQVRVNRDNDFPGAPKTNDYALEGAGLALAWAHPKGANARVTWSRRIGDNPNPDLKGNDQDGTLTEDRFWLEAGYAF